MMAPIVVSYASRLEKVTVGVANVETACILFGDGGLNGVWPRLGKGWGGRESVGGSPRGLQLQLEDAYRASDILLDALV